MALEDAAPEPVRRSRFWLFAPFVFLGLLTAAWTAAWFVIREGTREALDAWIAGEAVAGRQWECPGRTVGGFPFRLEIACPSLRLARGDWSATLGPVRAVAQVYRPRHVIVEIDGPFRATGGGFAVDASWRSLRASIRGTAEGFQRASFTAEAPVVKAAGPPGALDLRSGRFEAHLRPHPSRWQGEGAVEISARSSQALVPLLNELIGGAEPADIDLQLTVTQARDVSLRPLSAELERWRQEGGRLEIGALSVAKGPRRLEAKGEAALDALRRPAGRFEVSAAGLEGVLGAIAGSRLGGTAGAVLGSLLGQPARPVPSTGPRELSRLPLRIENGRLSIGPLTVPGIRFAPLY
jgi:hypothetical protein